MKSENVHFSKRTTAEACASGTAHTPGEGSLAFPEQAHRYDDIHTARETCGWLTIDPHYQAWVKSSQGLFWIKGNPGAGKSVLMKLAVMQMKKTWPRGLTASFFFHGQGKILQKSPTGMFRALLNSLLEFFPAHLAQLTAKFEREIRHGGNMEGRWNWTHGELQELLSDVLIKNTKYQPVVIFIDALDECGEDSAKILLAFFKDIVRLAEPENAQIRLCFSSRHYPILGLNTIPMILVEERNEEDIRWFTRERLKEIRSEANRRQLEVEILSKARGGFQWVFLITEMIVGRNLTGAGSDASYEELAASPESLNELYATLLDNLPEAEKPQTFKLFQWVLFAERPLSAQELREALALDKDMTSTSIHVLRKSLSWSGTLTDFERHVNHLSKGLVQFQTREIWEKYEPDGGDSDREAQLIHQSVADYLLDGFLSRDTCNEYGLQSPVAAGHFQISRSCFRYLMTNEVLEGVHLQRGPLSSRFPLAPYATRFLFRHIQMVEQEGVLQLDLLSLVQWAPQSKAIRRAANLWRILDPDYAHTPIGWPFSEATVLHVLAALGSTTAFNHFLDSNIDDVDGRDQDGNTPLHIAIRESHEDIALTLLNRAIDLQREEGHHIDFNDENDDGDTALTIALAEKADVVIFRLIEAGANLKYMGRETALVFFAISSRSMKLLVKLIDRGVNVDGAVYFALRDRPRAQDTLLEDLVSTLLRAGANTARLIESEAIPEPEDYDEFGEESVQHNDAICIAARRGYASIVDLLLSHGVSVTSRNEDGQFPLQLAAKNGHEGIVRALLHSAPSTVELEDLYGHTALDAALENGSVELLTVLLSEGRFSSPSPALKQFFDLHAAVDLVETLLERKSIALDFDKEVVRTMLLWAAAKGETTIVQLILESSRIAADPKDEDQRTPLWWAAYHGHATTMQLLLTTATVDVNAPDKSGSTPLSRTAQNGHLEVAKLLLEALDVNVNALDESGRTPLAWAARNGHAAIIQLLLTADTVDVNARDQKGRSTLSWAACNSYLPIVKMLLNMQGTNLNLQDRNGIPPLSLAIWNGHNAVVKLLLSTAGVNINTKDFQGRTPLLWAAASKEHLGIIKMLLASARVDVNLKDQDGQSPLSLAAWNGHEHMVRLLLATPEIDINSVEIGGQTPLSRAAWKGHVGIVKLILDKGNVDVNVKDVYEQTPLSWAARNGHEAIVELLRSHSHLPGPPL